MKERVQEFDITINFHFDSGMTIEAESEKEALKIAQKFYLNIIRDHLRDRDNLNIKVHSHHTITEDERAKLESEGIVEPRRLTKRQQAKLERETARRAFVEKQNAEAKRRRKNKQTK